MSIKNWDFSVERGHFLNFGGALSFLKFWWSTVISQILVEHGHLSYFGGAWSFVIFWRSMVIKTLESGKNKNWLVGKFDRAS